MNTARFAALFTLSGTLALVAASAVSSASDAPAPLGMTNEQSARVVTRELTSDADRNRAVELAKRVKQNLVVVDKIDVIPLAATGHPLTSQAVQNPAVAEDSYIYSTVIAGLTADPDTSVRDILVNVDGQVVTLRGDVASPHVKQAAQRIAADTRGVKAVRNFLTIKAG